MRVGLLRSLNVALHGRESCQNRRVRPMSICRHGVPGNRGLFCGVMCGGEGHSCPKEVVTRILIGSVNV